MMSRMLSPTTKQCCSRATSEKDPGAGLVRAWCGPGAGSKTEAAEPAGRNPGDRQQDGGADDVTLATLGKVLLEPTLTTLGNFLVRSARAPSPWPPSLWEASSWRAT